MPFYQFYDCSNILEVTLGIIVIGSVTLSILNMFKPDLKEKKVAAHHPVTHLAEHRGLPGRHRSPLRGRHVLHGELRFLHLAGGLHVHPAHRLPDPRRPKDLPQGRPQQEETWNHSSIDFAGRFFPGRGGQPQLLCLTSVNFSANVLGFLEP